MTSKDDTFEPPAHLTDDVPLPDDEWIGGGSASPPDDVPPPDDAWMPADAPPAPPPSPDELASASDRPAPSSKGSTTSRGAATPSGGASDASGSSFGRGVEVKIIGGKEGVGTVGEIFWWGESKYGEGMRAGVRGPGETTYWVDEGDLGLPDDEVPEEVMEAVAALPDMGKGDRVRVVSGKGVGSEGVIFWWGESKYGDGMRAGVETDGGETVWADSADLERIESGSSDEEEEADDIPF